jgi:hypothetical protein
MVSRANAAEERDMDAISIEGISALEAALTRQQIDIAILNKARGAQEQQAEAVMQLLESAGLPEAHHHGEGAARLDVSI